MRRRRFLVLALATLSVACSRSRSRSQEVDPARCAFCGMKIDPTSAWRADLVKDDGTLAHFDTPRCALLAWRTGKTPAKSLRVQEFYDRTWRDGADLRFAIGSDVAGPMGPDVVPIDPSRAAKFRADHSAAEVVSLSDLTAARLDALQ
jgi:ribosomal protein L24E